MTQNTLLIEFLTEELPPINMEQNIAKPFASAIANELAGFLDPEHCIQELIAPRRFGVIINGINSQEQDQTVSRKGPAVSSALQNGEPTKALLGFAKSCGVEWSSLEQKEDDYFYFTSLVKGKELNQVMSTAIANALKKINITKAMHWGDKDTLFVRPVHKLTVLFNEQVVACKALGLHASNITNGHRFMSNGDIQIKSAQNYLEQMRVEGKVIANFTERKNLIQQQLATAANQLNLNVHQRDGLLDEVCALVEYPCVLTGEFDKKFLDVPQECLILSMATNQKYFALVDNKQKLSNKFLFVANLESKNPSVVIHGNEKVLSARLADAEFFYHFDKRTPFNEFSNKLKNVVYHNQLGTQYQRLERLAITTAYLADKLGIDKALAHKTTFLLKSDLMTEMVGEFPELQGVMGKYYALNAGESNEVANAIEKHYYPRFSGDELPDSNLASIMALADKLETIVGIWGIGLIPTGSKDPYALRRAALGIIRILLETQLDIKELIAQVVKSFDIQEIKLASNTQNEVDEFVLQRLANYITTLGYSTNIANAVIKSTKLTHNNTSTTYLPKTLTHIPTLLDALQTFENDLANKNLVDACKRTRNILEKNAQDTQHEVTNTLCNDIELALFNAVSSFDPQTFDSEAVPNFALYFEKLRSLEQPLSAFFDNVMVMDEDSKLRKNRLALLNECDKRFGYFFKISELG